MANLIKRHKKYIILSLIVSIVLFISCFVFMNFHSIVYNSKIINVDLNNVELNDIDKENDKLVITGSEPSISFNIDENYINRIKFNYDAELNYYTKIYYNKEEKKTVNSSVTHLFVERLDAKTNNVTMRFDEGIKSISNISIDNSYSYDIRLFVLFEVIYLIVSLIIINRIYFSKNIHKLFLLIAIPIGVLILLYQSPIVGAGGDDDTHFGVTYQMFRTGDSSKWEKNAVLSRNGFVNFLLFNTKEEIQDAYEVLDDMTDLVDHDFDGSLSFSRISYIPSALVYRLIYFISHKMSLSIICSKIINFVIFIIVIYYAIKIIPKYKAVLAFIGLIPTSLFISCQFSYDSRVTSFMLLSLALIVRAILDKKYIMDWKRILLLLLLSLYGASAKGIYIIMILLGIAIPTERFKNKKTAIIFRILLLLSIIFVFSTFFMSATQGAGDVRVDPDASNAGQISYMIHYPSHAIRAYYNGAVLQFTNVFFGPRTLNTMAYYGVTNSMNAQFLTLVVFVITAMYSISRVDITKRFRFWALISTVIMVFLIWTAMYISCTSVGATHIDGVQGRYFVPLLFPLIICFSTKNRIVNITDEKYTIFFGISISAIWLLSILNNIIIPYF